MIKHNYINLFQELSTIVYRQADVLNLPLKRKFESVEITHVVCLYVYCLFYLK